MEQDSHKQSNPDPLSPTPLPPNSLPEVNALLAQQAKRARRQLALGFLGLAAILGGSYYYQRQHILDHAHPYDRALMQIAVDFSAPDLCAKIKPTANKISSEFSSGTRAHLLQANCYYLSAIKSGDPALCSSIHKPVITIGQPITMLADAKECTRTLSNPQLMNEENASLALDTLIPPEFFTTIGYTPELLRHFFSKMDDATRARYHVDLNNPETLSHSYYLYLQESKDQNARDAFVAQVRNTPNP